MGSSATLSEYEENAKNKCFLYVLRVSIFTNYTSQQLYVL